MDIVIGLVAGVVGLVVGGVVAWIAASGKGAAARAAAVAEAELLRKRDAEVRAERDAARDETKEQSRSREDAEGRAKVAEVSLREGLKAAEDARSELQKRLTEALAKMEATFKATSGDALKQQSEAFLLHANAQFKAQQALATQQSEARQEQAKQDLEARQKSIAETMKPISEQLQKQQELVTKLSEKQEGDAKTFAEQFRNIAQLQTQAREAAMKLSAAMRDNRQRGQWGEVALKNAVEFAGMNAHVDFTEQATFEGVDGERLRPDMVVRLPGNRAIPVDCKVPMDSYLVAVDELLDEAVRAQARSQHAAAVRSHVLALSRKNYAASVDGEVDYTVLYIPVESALSAAMEEDGDLLQYAIGRRVLVVGGNALVLLLRTAHVYWANDQVTRNAQDIGAEAQELCKRVATYVGHVARVGKSLEGTVKAYNESLGSLESRVLVSSNKIAKLAAAEESEEPAPVDVAIRPLRELPGGEPEPPGA
ncbi:MAG: DNA recombination protein RmuC [Planctomycetota bacterium]|nr:DNA recombination protein RmuC [Planctomycetota bacterium]MDA1105884.1 DNA recombination protein RmuC [Planctomycetota bacterium]